MSDKYAKILKKKGILIIKNIFSKSQSKVFKTSLKKILDKRVKMKKNVGSFNSQLIYSYFYENTNFRQELLS